MRADLVLYGRLARAGFRRFSTYRLAMLGGLVTNSVFGFIRASILLAAIASAGGTVAGYSRSQASSYVWWSQALLASLALFVWTEVSDRVRSGDIAVDFARPLDVQLGYLAADLGRAAVQFLPRGVPSLAIGALTFGISFPRSAIGWAAGVVSLVLAVTISFGLRYAVNVLAFWLIEVRGVQLLYMVLSGFCCGLYVPVAWFPHWLEAAARATPFPSILQSPVDILSGRAPDAELLPIMGTQLAWVALTLGAGRALSRLGRRRLEVQGG